MLTFQLNCQVSVFNSYSK